MIPVAWIGPLAIALAAQSGVTVEVTLEPPVVPFHRQAVFTISVEAPAGTPVKIPEMTDSFGGLGIYGAPTYEHTTLKRDRVRRSERYVLDPIFVADYVIKPVVVQWGDGESLTVPSPMLRVRDLTEEELEEAMIFDSELAEPSFLGGGIFVSWWFWALVLLGTAMACALGFYWWRKGPQELVVEPIRSPWKVAYERLQALDERQLMKQGQFGPFYVDLSSILRFYIEDRFHVHAPEQTTPEFLSEVSESGVLSTDHQAVLAPFLRHCDRVKFAQYEPGREEMEHSFTTVLQFVDETVPQDETKTEAAAA